MEVRYQDSWGGHMMAVTVGRQCVKALALNTQRK